MKLTKTQLREIIKEEISKLNKQPKMSTRLKELINKGWVLNEVDGYVKNPVTGREIKVTTALSYPEDHPAYKAADKVNTNTGNSTGTSKPKATGTVFGKKSTETKPQMTDDEYDERITQQMLHPDAFRHRRSEPDSEKTSTERKPKSPADNRNDDPPLHQKRWTTNPDLDIAKSGYQGGTTKRPDDYDYEKAYADQEDFYTRYQGR
jgi:hypothetical protein